MSQQLCFCIELLNMNLCFQLRMKLFAVLFAFMFIVGTVLQGKTLLYIRVKD